MELDELKTSWNKLNEHLEKKNLINEQALENLIAQHKHNADRKINKIAGIGKFSIAITGLGLILLFIGFIFIIPSLDLSTESTRRIHSLGAFFAVILRFGGSWDLITYLWIKKTDIETLPVVKVIERINRFRQWTKYEIWASVIAFFILIGIQYYVNGIYERSLENQLIFFLVSFLIIGIITFVLYKRLIFDNLYKIKKDLEELHELKND